jgi:hypothetical protein
MKDGVLQPLDRQELEEISRELGVMNLNRRLMVPLPYNSLYPSQYHLSFHAALDPLPISPQTTNLALTLISALYPSRYGWNLPDRSRTFLTIPTTQTLASRSTSSTEDYQYEQVNEGIVITGSNGSHRLYQDRSYIPTPRPTRMNGDYPYGWSAGIEEFCSANDHHPDCTDPIRRAFIEREFIVHTINNPERFKALDDYLNIIHTNAIGKSLQWLKSSPTPVPDNLHERAELSQLYTQIDNQNGQALHSKNGLRIVIPEEKWINWKTFTPNAQKEFTRVAWAQLTQFDKMALMTGLRDGKLDDKLIYFDFDDDAKHDQFWTTELDSVRRYFIELITQTGVYNYYNLYVMQELAYDNDPIDLSLLGNWSAEGRPPLLFLPYSQLALKWDSKRHKWDYENYGQDSLSPYSSSSPYSLADSEWSLPSLAEPIDEFEQEDVKLN